MDQNNRNQNNPFGAYGLDESKINRPRDITSDLWTPISTGVPVSPPPKLHDENEAPPQRTPQSRPAQKRPAQKKPAAKKRARPQKKQTAAAPQADPMTRPVLKEEPPRRERAAADRSRRVLESDNRQYQRDLARFASARSAGHSSDDIRRQKAKRKRRNKRVIAVATVAGVMLLAGLIALIYCYAYGFPIAKISVTGKSNYTNEQIINASGVRVGDNMLRVHTKEVNRTVTAVLPYISAVKVEYKLPDTLNLRVTQTQEKYLIVGKQHYICLNEAGKVLSLKKKKAKAGQFRLEGFDQQDAKEGAAFAPEGDNAARYEAAKTLIAELEACELPEANVLNLADLHLIRIQYDGRINIYLNGTDDAEEKIALIAGILKNEIPPGSQGYIDGRFAERAFFNQGSMTLDG